MGVVVLAGAGRVGRGCRGGCVGWRVGCQYMVCFVDASLCGIVNGSSG